MMAKVRTHSAVVASFVRHFGAESLQGYQLRPSRHVALAARHAVSTLPPAEPNLTSDPERVRPEWPLTTGVSPTRRPIGMFDGGRRVEVDRSRC